MPDDDFFGPDEGQVDEDLDEATDGARRCEPLTQAQKVFMVNYMEGHPHLAQKEHNDHYHGVSQHDQEWVELKHAVDCVPGPPQKTVAQWKEVLLNLVLF